VGLNTYQVEIIEPGAKRLLDDMAELGLISIRPFVMQFDDPQNRRGEILALAGAWDDMTENDFDEFLVEAKRSGSEAFSRNPHS
jgi:hypothetical protein